MSGIFMRVNNLFKNVNLKGHMRFSHVPFPLNRLGMFMTKKLFPGTCQLIATWSKPLEGTRGLALAVCIRLKRRCFPPHCKFRGSGWGSPRPGKMTIIIVPGVYIAPFFN